MLRLLKITCFMVGLLTILQSLTLLTVRAQHDPNPFMVLHERQRSQHRLIAYIPEIGWKRTITPLMDDFSLVKRPDGSEWGLVTMNPRDVSGGQNFGRPYHIDWQHLDIEPVLDHKVPVGTVRISQDGQWLVYFAPKSDGTIEVMRVRSNGRDPLPLSTQFDPPPSVNVWEWLVFSGDWVYFSELTPLGGRRLYHVRVDGTDGQIIELNLIALGTILFAPPASDWLVGLSAVSAFAGMMNVETGEQIWFEQDGMVYSEVSWIPPDIFITQGVGVAAWRLGESHPLWTLPEVASLQIGMDNWLLISAQAGTHLIAIIPDGQERLDIIPPVHLTRSELWAWSADRQWLIFSGMDEVNGVREVWRHRASDGIQQKIATIAGYITFQGVSPDGAWLFYGEIGAGSKRFYRMRADGTEQTLIAPNGSAWEYELVDWITMQHDWSSSMSIFDGLILLIIGLTPHRLFKRLRHPVLISRILIL